MLSKNVNNKKCAPKFIFSRVAENGACNPLDFKVGARKKARIGNSSWLARKKSSSSSDP